MKHCPKCKKHYPDENLYYCSQDGEPLEIYDPEEVTTQQFPDKHRPPSKVSTSMSRQPSLSSIQRTLKQINNKLDNWFLFLKSEDEIYSAVIEAINKAKHHIRIVRLGSRPAVTDDVLEAIKRKVVDDKVTYHIVVVLDPKIPIGGFEKNHGDLMEKFGEDKGAEIRYKPHVLETNEPICFDTIIVDGTDVGIGITHAGGVEDLQEAIMFHNPKVAGNLVRWFDNVIKDNPSTKSYYDWEKGIKP